MTLLSYLGSSVELDRSERALVVKERPILFSAPMVRALLAGTKTQTRRAWRIQPPPGVPVGWVPGQTKQPYGWPGDRLWVRESMHFADGYWRYSAGGHGETFDADYVAGEDEDAFTAFVNHKHAIGAERCPSIHMPRWASRILLEVTEVRAERLQSISEDDAAAEGIIECDGLLDEVALCHRAKAMNIPATEARVWYAELWESINGTGSWDANPWVWVIEFRRIDPGTVQTTKSEAK